MNPQTIPSSRRRAPRNVPAALAIVTISALGTWAATELVATAPASSHVTVKLINSACLTSDPVRFPCPVVP